MSATNGLYRSWQTLKKMFYSLNKFQTDGLETFGHIAAKKAYEAFEPLRGRLIAQGYHAKVHTVTYLEGVAGLSQKNSEESDEITNLLNRSSRGL